MPERVQLRRTKGWRLPPNTVKVCRSGRWGNPYRVGEGYTAAEAVEAFRTLMERRMPREAFEGLRGKNLACWCPLGEPCHADVLLDIANRERD